jgi:hypothetical protein
MPERLRRWPSWPSHHGAQVTSDSLTLTDQHVRTGGGPRRPLHRIGQHLKVSGEVA